MRTAILSLPATCALLLAAIPMQPSGTLFENDQVRVARATEKAHVKGAFHEHKPNRVMIYLQAGKQRFEYQDGRKPQVFDWTEGQIKWSPADGFHSPEVIGDSSFNIIEVELKHPGGAKFTAGPQDAVKLDAKHFKVEIDNDEVRVLRVKVGPHEKVPMHQHYLNRVRVFLTDADIRTTGSDGKSQMDQHKAGDAAWSTPSGHSEENMSDRPMEVVLVEIKG